MACNLYALLPGFVPTMVIMLFFVLILMVKANSLCCASGSQVFIEEEIVIGIWQPI
jgi:hypothetical protein